MSPEAPLDGGGDLDAEARLRKLIHDLRTPTTVIAGFAEMLERGGPELARERHDEYVARIAAAARELRELLDANQG